MKPDTRYPGSESKATWLDYMYQWAFRIGFKPYKIIQALFVRESHGAFLGVWWNHKILIIKNSYVDFRTLPGGGISNGELPNTAAVRECFEEVGIHIDTTNITLDFVDELQWRNTQNTVWVFFVRIDQLPAIKIDHREVIEATFLSPSEALELPLFIPARRHIQRQCMTMAGRLSEEG